MIDPSKGKRVRELDLAGTGASSLASVDSSVAEGHGI